MSDQTDQKSKGISDHVLRSAWGLSSPDETSQAPVPRSENDPAPARAPTMDELLRAAAGGGVEHQTKGER